MIPTRTLEAIQHWQEGGMHPAELGGFVRALLSNDLREAVGKADDENFAALKETVSWVHFNLPSNAWGSKEKLLAYYDRTRDRRVA